MLTLSLRILLGTGAILTLVMLGTGVARRRVWAAATSTDSDSAGWVRVSLSTLFRLTNAWLVVALALILIIVAAIHREDAFLDGLAVAFAASEPDPERRVQRIG